MKIDMKVHSLEQEGKCVARLSATLDDSFVIRGLRLMEGKNGLFNTQSEGVDIEDVCRGLGEVFTIGDTYNKLYPSCRHAQPGIEAVLDLSAEHGIRPEDVESIWIGTHQVAYDLTGTIMAPKNAGEAKFSLAYGSAVALREHSFGVSHLMAPSYTAPENLALAEKVTCVVDPEVQAVYPKQRGARVKITLKDGSEYEKELYDLKGSPNNPVGWPELAAKFTANAQAVLSAQTVDMLLERLAALEKLKNIGPIMDLVV